MAKYRIMALPPNYKKGGGRKKKEVTQPGQWAGINPEIIQPGEEGFDLPASNAAPQSEFAIEQMSPEEQAAYLKKARYDEAMASYKPLQAEYKGLTRPSAQLILGEDYDADPSKFTNAGYFPIKTENGNYELMANKDIANLIYQKGIRPEVLSSTFGLGDAANIQKTFEPIYTHAASIHAQRNKEKIDQLVAKGFTKDQAINELVRQGEGNVEGLTKRYGEYTDAAFKKAQSDASKITTNGKQPSNFSKELYEGVQNSYNEAYAPMVKKAEENVASWDPYAIQPAESTAVRNTMIYDLDKGEYKTKGTTAHEDNLNNIAVYENINEEREKGQREYVDAIKKLALDKNLTDDQKKSLLANPQAVEQLVGDYNKWRLDNKNAEVGNIKDYNYLHLPYDQAVTVAENTNKNLPENFYYTYNDPYTRKGSPKGDITFSESGTGTYYPATRTHSIDGGVDMLDEEWLAGVIGVTGLPQTYQAANVISKFAPIASLPSLNVGNALIAKGLYDSGTKYIPDAAKAYNQAQEEGWTNENTFDFGYNLLKTASSALPFTGALQEVKAVKNAKDAFSAGDATVGLLQTPDDPLKNYKAIKALGTIAGLKKQKGGSIQMELTDKEIKDYVKKGFIVEEVHIPEKQSGGTPSQIWYQYTGTPWSEAKAKGLTDGSMEQNLALAKRLQAGEFGQPKLSDEQYQNVRSGYDQMVEQMVRQGKTLDQLVQQRVGTREGLQHRFPELFTNQSQQSQQSTPTVSKSNKKSEAELQAARDWLTQKAKEVGTSLFNSIGDSYWGKLAKKAGTATIKYLEAEAANDKVKKAKEKQKVNYIEKKVNKDIKKVSEDSTKPSVIDILNQKNQFMISPFENLKKFTKSVDENKPQLTSGFDIKSIVSQIQKGQQQGPPPSLTSKASQEPLGDNSFAAQFKRNNSPQRIEELNARNKALGIKDINLPEVPKYSIGWKNFEDTDFGYAYEGLAEELSDSYAKMKNGIDRKLQTYGFVEDNDKKVKETPPASVEQYYMNPYAKQNRLKIENSNREFKQQLLPTSTVKLGFRNRGDYNDINSDGMEITTFDPFTKTLKDVNDNSGVLAIDSSGKLHAGTWKELKNNKNMLFSKTFVNKVVSIDDESVDGKKSGNPGYIQPRTTVMDDSGNLKFGSLNVLYKPKKEDYYGSIQGGRILVQDPKTKETYLISGSVKNIKDEFKRLKGNNTYMNVYTLDNGTYSRGLSFNDNKLTKDRLKAYDNENTSGGNGLYIVNYEKPINTFDEQIIKGMPNIRTKNDESYKKGHPLKNQIQNIVLHHTAHLNPETAKDAIRKQYLKKGNNSSHVVIYKDGSREIYASPEQVTFHAGESRWNKKDDVNDFAIGVEFDGDTNKEPLTEEQIKSFVEYYSPLAKKYNLKLKDIITHQMIRDEYIKNQSKNNKVDTKEDINNIQYKRILNYLKENGYN